MPNGLKNPFNLTNSNTELIILYITFKIHREHFENVWIMFVWCASCLYSLVSTCALHTSLLVPFLYWYWYSSFVFSTSSVLNPRFYCRLQTSPLSPSWTCCSFCVLPQAGIISELEQKHPAARDSPRTVSDLRDTRCCACTSSNTKLQLGEIIKTEVGHLK